MDRRTEILKHVTKDHKGIEIGPWFAPLAPKREGYNCLTFDVFDTETLRANAARDPYIDKSSIAAIEDVDIVGSSTEIEDVVAARGGLGSFDYIISSHNFEHLPNPIKFLQGCAKVLKPGGYLSMAVPDKRACFDYFRPISTLTGWVEAHIEDRNRPSLRQVFEQNLLHSRYHGSDGVQTGFSIEKDPSNVFALKTVKEAYSGFVSAIERGDTNYYDTHCWTFTPSSLRLLLLEINFLELTPFSISEVSDSQGNEFYVHLSNEGNSPLEPEVFYARRQELLHSLMNEQSFNSIYAHGLREGKHLRVGFEDIQLRGQIETLKSEVAALRSELEQVRQKSDFHENLVGDIRNSIAWRTISPLGASKRAASANSDVRDIPCLRDFRSL